jgi:hypothetical protein
MSRVSLYQQDPRTATRNAAEKRFRAYGLTAIIIALLALVWLLISIFSNGLPAFKQTFLTYPVTLDAAILDKTGARDPEVLAKATESALRDCGLGYRAENLLKTARLLADGTIDLEVIAKQPTARLRQTLQMLPGVGVKVANCILLFAYERLDAVPIDTWIHRILLAMRKGRDGTPAVLAAYARRRLGPYAGYVQQYLFHHARMVKKGK